MKRTTIPLPAEPFGRALVDAGHGPALAAAVLGFARNGATAWQRLRAASRRRRERVRTEKIISDLPRELRSDIGWPGRYFAEYDNDR
ncbi:MAG: hypothetical protein ACTHJ3_12880 [Pararhizobium sp.]